MWYIMGARSCAGQPRARAGWSSPRAHSARHFTLNRPAFFADPAKMSIMTPTLGLGVLVDVASFEVHPLTNALAMMHAAPSWSDFREGERRNPRPAARGSTASSMHAPRAEAPATWLLRAPVLIQHCAGDGIHRCMSTIVPQLSTSSSPRLSRSPSPEL